MLTFKSHPSNKKNIHYHVCVAFLVYKVSILDQLLQTQIALG
jgi:hypothetical protein